MDGCAVYPRECGGTRDWRSAPFNELGLSPRVRGNRQSAAGGGAAGRSIPASAGEPVRPRVFGIRIEVYPRECGGTQIAPHPQECLEGLSPRVRGNHRRYQGRLHDRRSIPASAGEPEANQRGGLVFRGLSPRVRGNQIRAARLLRVSGSIPASAGEPTMATRWMCRHGVYPRECGGTKGRWIGQMTCYGLSPRVRGNPIGPVAGGAHRGSIPASAGEPSSSSSRSSDSEVYPRECGGTIGRTGQSHRALGLSPRVRGNPTSVHGGQFGRWVYPRECGGTK